LYTIPITINNKNAFLFIRKRDPLDKQKRALLVTMDKMQILLLVEIETTGSLPL